MRSRPLALLLTTALALAACGDPTPAATTIPEPPTNTTVADPRQPQGEVSTSDTALGTVLVDPDGMTLYIFTPDPPGESVCYDDCAVIWPPVPAATPISAELASSLFGSTARTDGPDQLTVDGQPLYLYAGDTQPGDVNGQEVEGVWFVVDPQGAMIGAAEEAEEEEDDAESDSDDTGIDYDGY